MLFYKYKTHNMKNSKFIFVVKRVICFNFVIYNGF